MVCSRSAQTGVRRYAGDRCSARTRRPTRTEQPRRRALGLRVNHSITALTSGPGQSWRLPDEAATSDRRQSCRGSSDRSRTSHLADDLTFGARTACRVPHIAGVERGMPSDEDERESRCHCLRSRSSFRSARCVFGWPSPAARPACGRRRIIASRLALMPT